MFGSYAAAEFCDPLRGPQSSSRYWTTVNAAEALPGVPTPLNWSWYDTAAENAQVKAKVLVGVSRAGTTPSEDRDERHLGIFYGRCALNVDVWRSFADAVPGTSGDSLERDFLGSVRPGRPTHPQPNRYPIVGVKAPLAFRWARRKLTVEAAAHRRWWRDAVASAAAADERQARSCFAAALANFEDHVGLAHLVATMAANGLYGALVRVCDKAGHPGLERSLTTAMETEESRMLTALWALRSTDANSDAFLDDFGYQGPAAGELAKSSWRDDPGLLAAVVDRYRLLPEDQDPAAREARQRAEAKRARNVLMASLPRAARRPAEVLLRLVYTYLPLRESGRGAVLRAIDGSRAAAKVVGAHAAADGRMHRPDDVFMLTVPEIIGAAKQPSADELAFRRQRWEHYQTMRIPSVWTGVPEASPIVAPPDDETAALRGIGIGGGIVDGVARVVTDPAGEDQLEPGEVLVCHTTDPSWASLFLYAAAVVIDIGSALSHGAIVARELGVPCVINTGDGSRRLRSGDLVRVNGDAGTVERLRTGATGGRPAEGTPMTDTDLERDFRAKVKAANPFVLGPHRPTDDPGWQESVFLCWHDSKAGVGGWQRIGFEPNRNTCNQQTAAYAADGTRFRQVNHFLPFSDADRTREAFHANGTTTCRFESDSETRWIVDFGDDYRCNLLLEDIYPYTPLYATEQGRARDWAVDPEDADAFVPAHWETSARIRGEVRLAGRDYEIDGFAHRDQSFGFRDWKIIRSHRAFVGTFGEAFNFSMLNWHTNTDAYSSYGFIMRDGVEEWTDDVELVTYLAADGLTVFGGRATLSMSSGEQIVIDAEAHASIMLPNYEYFGVDTNCEITAGDLTGGYGDFEISNNPFDGRRYPTFATGTTLENGLFLP